jgi:hypothetical protein
MLLAYCYSAGVMAADCVYRWVCLQHHELAWRSPAARAAAALHAPLSDACSTTTAPCHIALCHTHAPARSVLGELTRRFTEADVAMMLTLLNAVGLQLRSADPAAMKVRRGDSAASVVAVVLGSS